jgi:hypothetical protein
MLEKILKEEAENISRIYKVSSREARETLEKILVQDPNLKKELSNAKTAKDLTRKRVFKDFVKKARKEIYYQLRTYRKDGPSEVESHRSTDERRPYERQFFGQVEPFFKDARFILDLGGGVFPLTFDFEKYQKIKAYIWIDKDKNSYQKLLDYKKSRGLSQLFLYPHTFGEEPWENYLPEGAKKFDFTFLLKTLPVIYRQERALFDKLLKLPSDKLLITGNKESMVKRVKIEKREDSVLQSYIRLSKRVVLKKVEIPNEFGYILN